MSPRDQGLEIAVARVGRTGARGRWAAVAWGAALATLVAVSIPDRPASAPISVNIARPHADPGPTPSTAVRVARIPAPRERTPGEDGLMGSLVLDLKPRDLSGRSWPVGKLGWTTNPAQS